MTSLKQLLIRPLKAVPNSLAIIFLLIALIGFADASYLTVEHFQGRIPPCSITKGCDKVLTSTYAELFGVPTSLAGAIYYFLILAGIFAYIESKNTQILKWTLFFTTAGFGFSLWFVYLQVFQIHSYCAYCLGSALTSTILFAMALVVFSKYSDIRSAEE